MKKHIKWNKVDWDVTDVVISGMVGVSRERVRQKRKDIISILKRSKEISELLRDPKASSQRLGVESTECKVSICDIKALIMVEQNCLARNGVADSPRLIALQKILASRVAQLRSVRHSMRLLKNRAELLEILKLDIDTVRVPQYWHRPSETSDILTLMSKWDLETMTRSSVVDLLQKHGYDRGFSWVSSALKGLGRGCLRQKATRNAKYDWGKLSKRQYRVLTDGECAELLGVGNPSVVTQWRSAHKILKVKPDVVSVAKKEKV